MKHIISVLLLMAFTLTTTAKDNISYRTKELFRHAMQTGRDLTHPYVLRTTDNDYISFDEAVAYAHSQHYLLGKADKKKVVRYGCPMVIVTYLTFLPENEFEDYFYAINTDGKKRSDATAKATGVVPTSSNPKTNHTLSSDIHWQGAVNKNGRLHGAGFGYIMNKREMTVFSGIFVDGMPDGEMFASVVNLDKVRDLQYYYASTAELETRILSADYYTVTMDDQETLYNRSGKVLFSNARFLAATAPDRIKVNDARRGEVYLNEAGDFVDLTERQKTLNRQAEEDRLERARKAAEEARIKELRRHSEDVNKALALIVKDDYVITSEDDAIGPRIDASEDLALVDKAIALCEQHKDEDRGFAYALPKLQQKRKAIEKAVANSDHALGRANKEYLEMLQKEYEELTEQYHKAQRDEHYGEDFLKDVGDWQYNSINHTSWLDIRCSFGNRSFALRRGMGDNEIFFSDSSRKYSLTFYSIEKIIATELHWRFLQYAEERLETLKEELAY